MNPSTSDLTLVLRLHLLLHVPTMADPHAYLRVRFFVLHPFHLLQDVCCPLAFRLGIVQGVPLIYLLFHNVIYKTWRSVLMLIVKVKFVHRHRCPLLEDALQGLGSPHHQIHPAEGEQTRYDLNPLQTPHALVRRLPG